MYEYEQALWDKGLLLCGVDEAGRGPLAGDVYAAAVILPVGVEIEGVNDSKKLTPKKREKLFELIQEKSAAWSIATATVEEIDRLNILQATFLAMRRAVEGLSIQPDMILVDGNRAPEIPGEAPIHTLVGGDAKSASIAAAMEKLALEYPEYLFEKHKGYGTKLHYEMLRDYGVSPVHRKTFLKSFYKQQSL